MADFPISDVELWNSISKYLLRVSGGEGGGRRLISLIVAAVCLVLLSETDNNEGGNEKVFDSKRQILNSFH